MRPPYQRPRQRRAIQAPTRPRATATCRGGRTRAAARVSPSARGSNREPGIGTVWVRYHAGLARSEGFYEHPRDGRRGLHRLAHGEAAPRRRPPRRDRRRPLLGTRASVSRRRRASSRPTSRRRTSSRCSREEKIDFVSHHAAQIDLRHSVSRTRSATPAPTSSGASSSSRPCGARDARQVLFSSTGRRHLRRAGGRPARDREPPDQPGLPLRLRQALDREVHALLPGRARPAHAGLPLRQRLRPLAGRHRRGRRRRDLLGGDAREPAAEDQRRRRADARLRLRRRPRRGGLAAPREATRAASGTSGPGSRRPSIGSSSSSRRSTATRRRPRTCPAPAGEQMRSVLDGSLVRRDFGLPPWTRLEDGLKATAEFFRSRHQA